MARCPICKQPSQCDGNRFFPFCSERCTLVDLGRWLGEDYRVPVEERPQPEPAPPSPNAGQPPKH